MPGFLIHVGATTICPHGGQISIASTNTRVFVGSKQQPVAIQSDTFNVAGCAFTVPTGKPQPCVTVKWLVAATRIMVGGKLVVLQNSVGVCQSADQIPQGPPNVAMTQIRVKGV
jgi:hypothetical protein